MKKITLILHLSLLFLLIFQTPSPSIPEEELELKFPCQIGDST